MTTADDGAVDRDAMLVKAWIDQVLLNSTFTHFALTAFTLYWESLETSETPIDNLDSRVYN